MLPCLLALLLGAPLPAPQISPLRQTGKAFGRPAEIEVRDLAPAAAREAIDKAFAQIAEIERLSDGARPDGGLAALNAAAGKGPQKPDPRLLAMLGRASDYCYWSEGAHGPLGRDLYVLWGLRSPVPAPPNADQAEKAVALTACTRLTLDLEKGTAELAAGSGLDLWGFAEGVAVDRAVEVLRQNGAVNGIVRIGSVQRGFGKGPGGKGWPVELPQPPGLEEPAGRLYLRDHALAAAALADHPLAPPAPPAVAAPYLNQRTGKPPEGILAAVVVTESAADAQGLATSVFILGPREGQIRMGAMRPRPSVLWFMGTGAGAPLQVDYRWSEVSRR
ncbi:MAG TPA: FAD:protein FMN transferase [Thermoanaerobaculia bacterium]|jgi:thiamine biosynthesis lipoprotein|nr:FAD:protein FMN transferase [Thermoanaerobaculia bacterium]